MTSIRLVTISAVFSAVLAWVLLLPSPAPVQGYGLTIEPAAPTEQDVVHVGFQGDYYYSSCPGWSPPQSVYFESASYSFSGQGTDWTIVIQEVWGFAEGQCNADSLEGTYGWTLDVGPLAAGDYTVDLHGDGYADASFTVINPLCGLNYDPYDPDFISICPAAPTEEDIVNIAIGYGASCPNTLFLSHSISGQTITIEFWEGVLPPGTMCEAVPHWIDASIDIGLLAAGDYSVEVGAPGGPFGPAASFTVTPDNCPSVPNPGHADANGNGVGDACDPADSDGDGFSDRVEYSTGTSRTSGCGVDAWPADINNNGFSDMSDLVFVTGNFGRAVPPAAARYDIAPDPPDGFTDITDIVRMVAFFGQSCTP